MAQRRPEKKQQLTMQRQRQILDAALNVFSKKGFAEATTAEIARTAGIAEGTIYNYYRTKRDLLIALLKDAIEDERLIQSLERAAGSGAASLQPIIEDRLKVGFEKSARFLVLASELFHDASLREQYVNELLHPILSHLEQYLESGVAGGAFRPMDTRLVARAMVSLGIGLAVVRVLEGEAAVLAQTPRDRIADVLAGIVTDGIRNRQPPAMPGPEPGGRTAT